jgi:hypothetical protein
MTNSNFKQRAKVGVAGSFFNQLMSNNQSIPEVGKGATEMHYTDRTCYEVVEVSEDLKTVRLQYLDAKWDKTKEGGMGHQNWILEPRDQFIRRSVKPTDAVGSVGCKRQTIALC